MYLDTWMIITIAAAFGLCANMSYSAGRRYGILKGITGTFDYLELHKVISIGEDGVIKATGKSLKPVDIIQKM